MTKIGVWVAVGILLSYFVFTSGLVYEVSGSNVTDKFIVPYSASLSGERTGLMSVYTKDDIKCAEWLAYKSDQSVPIVGDGGSWLLMKGYITQPDRLMLTPPPMDVTGKPAFNAYGDSTTIGDSASKSTLVYTSLISSATGMDVNNLGIRDAELADLFYKVYRNNVTPSTLSVMLIGNNDIKHFGDDIDALRCFEGNLYSYLVKLAMPVSDLTYAQDSSIIYTGNWIAADEGWGNHIKYTEDIGATATFNITGSVIYIDTIQFYKNTMGIKITIDGIDKGMFNGGEYKPTIIGKEAGIIYTSYLLRFDGLKNTNHTVVLTTTEGKGYIHFHWVIGLDGSQRDSPCVYVGTCLPSKDNENTVALYNVVIKDCVKKLSDDGLRVILVDTYSSINMETDLLSDGSLNDSGHKHIADTFLSKITPESIAKTHINMVRGGLYYIFIRTWNTEHQKLVTGGTSAGMRITTDLSNWKLDLYKEAFRSGEAVVYERK